ncbi:Transmembrane protein 53 [Allomyces arbusculus]|nr:Transmembrane protein 53 [Allomyces arbusculus]
MPSQTSAASITFGPLARADAPSDTSKPIADVVLIGWADGEAKHLAKYDAIYRDLVQGDIYLCESHTVDLVRSRSATWRYLAPLREWLIERGHVVPVPKGKKKAWEIASELDPPGLQRQLIFHVLSNGGVNSLACLWDMLRVQHHEQLASTAAIIFDSAPDPVAANIPWEGALLYTQAIPGIPSWLRPVVLRLMYAGLLTQVALVYGVLRIKPLLDRNFEMLCDDPNAKGVPRLMLYSDKDVFVPPREVELAIRRMRKAGSEVEARLFQGSLHVQHFRTFPKEYVATVHGFLKSKL